MTRKQHKAARCSSREEMVFTTNGMASEYHKVDALFTPAPQLSLSQHQTLTRKVMDAIRRGRGKRLSFSAFVTTVRDIITCTDSLLIRLAAYGVAVLLIAGLISGFSFAFSSFTGSLMLNRGGYTMRGTVISMPASTDSIAGRTYYLRSVQDYVMSQS